MTQQTISRADVEQMSPLSARLRDAHPSVRLQTTQTFVGFDLCTVLSADYKVYGNWRFCYVCVPGELSEREIEGHVKNILRRVKRDLMDHFIEEVDE